MWKPSLYIKPPLFGRTVKLFFLVPGVVHLHLNQDLHFSKGRFLGGLLRTCTAWSLRIPTFFPSSSWPLKRPRHTKILPRRTIPHIIVCSSNEWMTWSQDKEEQNNLYFDHMNLSPLGQSPNLSLPSKAHTNRTSNTLAPRYGQCQKDGVAKH